MVSVPKTMKAVLRLDEEGKQLKVQEIPVPVPQKGHVLVKIMASPCNPSDYYWAIGQYGLPGVKPKPPCTLGLEGSGIVVAVGEDVGKDLIGKKVL